ncbi:2-dehydro-3-deoxygalactonokinase [Desertibaculum subflavum]|uniref:2-dehydro-3-deoxygalactonokinase n=1 Tax=Desertibaculum subflavum TaxID=2268458 RepID=UPI000E66D3F4
MIGVDWGTSRFRAYRLGDGGAVLARREAALGVAMLQAADFPLVLEREIGDWLGETAGPVVLAGMVGSRQGWVEAPYLACPADAARIAAYAMPVEAPGASKAWIVPGLIARDAQGRADVLRGEETQLIGLMATLGDSAATICLPGTHSKWAEVAGGTIRGFATHMTGEMYDLILNRSMIGRVAAEGPPDDRAFAAGIGRAREGDGLLHQLFGARAAVLAGDLAGVALPSYLSGLLIGHEVFTVAPPSQVHVLAGTGLADRYAQALAIFGIRAIVHDADLAAAGLWRIGRALKVT